MNHKYLIAVLFLLSALSLNAATVKTPTASASLDGRPLVILAGSVTNAMWPIKDVDEMTKTAEYAHSLGVTAFETYVPWSVLEPQKIGEFNWTETDKLDSICRKSGLKWQAFVVMSSSYATPEWYRKSSEDVPHKCLEHNLDSDIRSIWCPNLDKHIEDLLAATFARYNKSPGLESVMFGVSGDFGESIYPAGAVGWNGQYHNHAGFWCAEEPAVKAFKGWVRTHQKSITKLNVAWGTKYSSFSDVKFQLPGKQMSDARWLDQSEWYRGEMTRWCERWFQIARKYANPNIPLYLCVGGGDNVMLGLDITGQAKLAAKYNVWLRLTNEGSSYPSNFMGTRQLTTAAKLYGVPSGLEPAGQVNARGVPARIFGAAAAGCNHLHYYEGQQANFNARTPIENQTQAWTSEREHLMQKAPYVNIAAFYPRIDAVCKHQMGTESLNLFNSLRDYTDFDMVDDNLVRDGKLDRYRYLLMGPCSTMDDSAYKQLVKWVNEGGVLVAVQQPSFRTWKPFGIPAFVKQKPLASKAMDWASLKIEMPAEFVIHPGNLPMGVDLTGDWSHPEGDLRWGGKDAGLLLNVNPNLDYTLTYEGGVPMGGAILVNGQQIGRIEGRNGNDYSYTFDIPSSLLKKSNKMQIDFRMAAMKLATDPRDLCIYPQTITLKTKGGNAQLSSPLMADVVIDKMKLASSTMKLGKGYVIALPSNDIPAGQYASIITKLLQTGIPNSIPVVCLPDGLSNGLFVTTRGDEVLVYNSNSKPVDAGLVLPEGAELDRYHRTVGKVIEIKEMAPDTIEAYPLKMKYVIQAKTGIRESCSGISRSLPGFRIESGMTSVE